MFGFIKKIINAITGKGESKKNNSYGGSKRQNAHGKKRGKRRAFSMLSCFGLFFRRDRCFSLDCCCFLRFYL